MESFIQLDLCKSALDHFRTKVIQDIDAFLWEDMGNIVFNQYRSRKSPDALKIELRQLIKPKRNATSYSSIIIDEWANVQFIQLDLTSSNNCRNLLHYLYLEFEESPFSQQLAKRFDQSAVVVRAQPSCYVGIPKRIRDG